MSTTRRTFLSALAAIAATCVAKPVGSDAPEPFNPRCPEMSKYGRCVKNVRPEHKWHETVGGERWFPETLDAERGAPVYWSDSGLATLEPTPLRVGRVVGRTDDDRVVVVRMFQSNRSS